MSKNRHSSQGVTLVEALIALLILGIGALGLISSAIFSKGIQQEAVEINEATKVAQAVLESFRKMPYIVLEDSLPAGIYTIKVNGSESAAPLRSYNIVESGLLYQLQAKLAERRLSDLITVEHAADALRISVQIRRNDDAGEPLIGMATYIVKNGINFR